MKKVFLFLLLSSFLFVGCGKDDETDDSGSGGDSITNSISIGGVSYDLNFGIASYYGQFSEEEGFNTDLILLSYEIEEGVEFEDIEDEDFVGFYVEAFSNVEEMLSEGTYTQSEDYTANTFTFAEIFVGGEYYELSLIHI